MRAQLEGKGEGVGGKTEFHVAKQQIIEGKGSGQCAGGDEGVPAGKGVGKRGDEGPGLAGKKVGRKGSSVVKMAVMSEKGVSERLLFF